MTVLFVAGAAAFFAAGAFFLITVDPLWLLESLAALPRATLGAGATAAVLFALPTPAAVVTSVAFLVAAPRVALAFSTMFVRMLAAPPDTTGAVAFRGEIGRARRDFPVGATGRIGDLGYVREFADRGERT